MVRQLRKDDAAAYRTIRLQALQNSPDAFATTYNEEKTRPFDAFVARLEADDAITYGYHSNETLTGIITLKKEPYVKMRHRASVLSLYVSEEAQRQSIGKNLLAHLIAEAKRIEGLQQLNLAFATTNVIAKKLYQSFGFVKFGYEKKALLSEDGRYIDEEHMVLFLESKEEGSDEA